MPLLHALILCLAFHYNIFSLFIHYLHNQKAKGLTGRVSTLELPFFLEHSMLKAELYCQAMAVIIHEYFVTAELSYHQ
ncbi:hypothetical protein BDF14DRAFT_1771459 [Spinellus fusiger]|nr:hypothetical protein BDF14DRAFT_1771459 [Spinellus fusiger]